MRQTCYYHAVIPLLLLASSMASSFSARAPWNRRPYLTGSQGKITPTIMRGGSDVNDDGLESSGESSLSRNATTDAPESTTTNVVQSTTSKLGPNAPPPGLVRKLFPSFPWHVLPNWLTYARCLAIPAMMGLFYLPGRHVETSALFAFASFTDWLDGYLARRWDITSAFGAFLDPVADKLMVSTCLVLLAGRYGLTVAIPTSIILAREISVSALREWMAQKQLRGVVQVGFQGKVKTALTMVSLTLLLLVPESGSGAFMNLLGPSLILLYLCTVITVTSGSVYFKAAAPYLMENQD